MEKSEQEIGVAMAEASEKIHKKKESKIRKILGIK